LPPLPCMLVCALFCAHCTRDRGCSVHPAFPAPSLFSKRGKELVKPRTRRAAGTRVACRMTSEGIVQMRGPEIPVPALAEIEVRGDEGDAEWRKRPGFKAIERLLSQPLNNCNALSRRGWVILKILALSEMCSSGHQVGRKMVAVASQLLPLRNTVRRFNRHCSQFLHTPLFSHTPP